MSSPPENMRAGLLRAMNTTSSPSSTASEEISLAAVATRSSTGCRTVTSWLDRRYDAASVSTCGVSENSFPSPLTKPPRWSVNSMRRAGARGSSAARARSLSGTGEIAQRHRAGRDAEALQQAQPAIEALDEIRRAFVALASLQLGHGVGSFVQNSACCRVKACHSSPIRSIGEQTPFHKGCTRHDEPGAERPDHPHRCEGPLREADAKLLAAGGAGGRARRRSTDPSRQIARRKPGAVPRRDGALRPDRSPLCASRRRSRLRTARAWRPALRLPWLAVRRHRAMHRDAGGAEGLKALPEHPSALLP